MNSQSENRVSLKPTERRGGRRRREGVGLKLNLQFPLKISERAATVCSSHVCAMKIISLVVFVKNQKGIRSKLSVQQTLFVRCSSLVCRVSAWYTSGIARGENSPLRCWQSSDSSVESQPEKLWCSYTVMGPPEFASTDRVTDMFTEFPKPLW